MAERGQTKDGTAAKATHARALSIQCSKAASRSEDAPALSTMLCPIAAASGSQGHLVRTNQPVKCCSYHPPLSQFRQSSSAERHHTGGTTPVSQHRGRAFSASSSTLNQSPELSAAARLTPTAYLYTVLKNTQSTCTHILPCAVGRDY